MTHTNTGSGAAESASAPAYEQYLKEPEERSYTSESLFILLEDYFMFNTEPISAKTQDALCRMMKLLRALNTPDQRKQKKRRVVL